MSDNRNATASWSGYLHQGKVGILVALREINRLLLGQSQLEDWEIVYENAEDFDIKNNGKVFSRHQVKAYRDATLPNDVSDVLGVLTYEKMDKGNCKIKNKGFAICQFDNDGEPLDVDVDEKSRYLHTISEIQGFNLSEIEFKKNHPKAKFVPNPNKIQLYQYSEDKLHCPFSADSDELKYLCISEIGAILERENHIEKNNNAWQENIYDNLLAILDSEIRDKHISKIAAYPTLTFAALREYILNNSNVKKSNIHSIREVFVNAFGTSINELKYRNKLIDASHVKIVTKIIAEIYNYDNELFIQFLKNVNPDENQISDIKTISDITKLCKKDNFKEVFFECLLRVTSTSFELQNLCYSNRSSYTLSAINRNRGAIEIVIRAIMNNSHLTADVFDKDYLINGHITSDGFFHVLKEVDDTTMGNIRSNNWKYKISDADKFNNPDLQLITVEDAITAINCENKQ